MYDVSPYPYTLVQRVVRARGGLAQAGSGLRPAQDSGRFRTRAQLESMIMTLGAARGGPSH